MIFAMRRAAQVSFSAWILKVVVCGQGDAHVGEGANGFHFDNSSGEYSDMLTSIKVEHQRVNSM